MNFVIYDISTGEREVIPQFAVCAWKDHSLCNKHIGQFVLPSNMRIVQVEIYQALHEVVLYVQDQTELATKLYNGRTRRS